MRWRHYRDGQRSTHVEFCGARVCGQLEEAPGGPTIRRKWAACVSKVLRGVRDAEAAGDREEEDRMLEWWCVLPRLLFRRSPRGGTEERYPVTRRLDLLIGDRQWNLPG